MAAIYRLSTSYILLFWLLTGALLAPDSMAQTPFTVLWSFDSQNTSGTSNSTAVSANNMATNGVNIPGVASIAYVAGQSGQAVNVQNWSTSGCNNSEYVTFTVNPNSAAQITVTQFSLFFSRSNSGPTQFIIRSSADNYASDLYSQAPGSSFQQATVSVSNMVNQTGPLSFRIYACSATASGGTIRLDEVTIQGTVRTGPLPVELVSFTAKPQGERVQLSWATSWERNAERFEVQRSHDLGEFLTIGTLSAKGTTDQRQLYGFVDERPLDGANYYRLKQVDFDGTTEYSNVVAAVMDELTPSLEILGNPVQEPAIRVVIRNLPGATYRLTTLAGQELAVQAGASEADGSLTLTPAQPLRPGMYLLRADARTGRIVRKVVVE